MQTKILQSIKDTFGCDDNSSTWPTRIFNGFRSRWAIPCVYRNETPSRNWCHIKQVDHSRGPTQEFIPTINAMAWQWCQQGSQSPQKNYRHWAAWWYDSWGSQRFVIPKECQVCCHITMTHVTASPHQLKPLEQPHNCLCGLLIACCCSGWPKQISPSLWAIWARLFIGPPVAK